MTTRSFLLVANWKANLTVGQAGDWLNDLSPTNIEIVFCPSFPILGAIYNSPVTSSLSFGAQDVSIKPVGAYTGQVPAELIKDIAKYCLVGHSETRSLFGVTSQDVQVKIDNLRSQGIRPIVCGNYAQLTQNDLNDYSDLILAYEPEESISTNPKAQPQTVAVATEKIKSIKNITGCPIVLYGGSVTVNNIHDFYSSVEIDGALVGKASIDINSFNQIISLCL